jgi:hypothetical protein
LVSIEGESERERASEREREETLREGGRREEEGIPVTNVNGRSFSVGLN